MLHFNFSGLKLKIDVEESEFSKRLKRDFKGFETDLDHSPHHRITVVVGKSPCWGRGVRLGRARFYPFKKFFSSIRFVSFFDAAWVSYDYTMRAVHLTCDGTEASYEALYLTVLSYVGERLDERGWHRMHGFGFCLDNQASVLMAPSRGGKTSIGMSILNSCAEAAFISDDTPLVGPKAVIRAFPLRVAFREPRANTDVFLRTGHGQKHVMQTANLDRPIYLQGPLKRVFILSPSRTAFTRPASAVLKWKSLFLWLVVGYETPQIWELYLRWDVSSVRSKCRILCRRLRSAFQLRGVEFTEVGRGEQCEQAASLILNALGHVATNSSDPEVTLPGLGPSGLDLLPPVPLLDRPQVDPQSYS